jgi:hypothetical protein
MEFLLRAEAAEERKSLVVSQPILIGASVKISLLPMAEYVEGKVPDAIPTGKVLVHNHIRHNVDTPSGERGFRAWYQDLTENLTPCACGYAGLPHYRVSRAGERG